MHPDSVVTEARHLGKPEFEWELSKMIMEYSSRMLGVEACTGMDTAWLRA